MVFPTVKQRFEQGDVRGEIAWLGERLRLQLGNLCLKGREGRVEILRGRDGVSGRSGGLGGLGLGSLSGEDAA